MRLIYPSLVLVIIVAACTSDDAVVDSHESLLEIAENTCAATRQTLENYLEARELNEIIRDSWREEARKADPAIDSAFASTDSLIAKIFETRPGLLLENTHVLIERLAAENKPPTFIRVSVAELYA